MFSIALWDTRLQKLLLIRDRFGEKPLFYYRQGRELCFASELRALREMISGALDISEASFNIFFHYQCIPAPLTPYKNVFQVPPACCLKISLTMPEPEITEYWDLANAPIIHGNASEIIREELIKTITLMSRADVPTGVALSGGLDSGAIALLASPLSHGAFKAFSVGYPGHLKCDERRYAAELAARLGIPFVDAELSVEGFVQDFPSLMVQSDEPVADIAAYGIYSVMKLAAQNGVKVVFSGIGGDELFWGYDWVRTAAIRSRKGERRHSRGITPLLERLGLRPPHPKDQLSFYDMTPGFKEAERVADRIYSNNLRDSLALRAAYNYFTVPQPWPNVPLMISKLLNMVWLTPNCLTLGDRLSMANSVEVRVPFVDHKLAETVWGLRHMTEDLTKPPKKWLKDALGDKLPRSLKRRKKRGFTPPVNLWVSSALKAYRSRVEEGSLVRTGMVQRKPLQALLINAINDGVCLTAAYRLLVFEIWHQETSA